MLVGLHVTFHCGYTWEDTTGMSHAGNVFGPTCIAGISFNRKDYSKSSLSQRRMVLARLQPASRTWRMRCPAPLLQQMAARKQVPALQHAPAKQRFWRTRMTTARRRSQKESWPMCQWQTRRRYVPLLHHVVVPSLSLSGEATMVAMLCCRVRRQDMTWQIPLLKGSVFLQDVAAGDAAADDNLDDLFDSGDDT
jgi:hypothetical protein